MDPADVVYTFVKKVPRGKVVTYGQVAGSIDIPAITPRVVGGIMAACPDGVPWHRVVGSGGLFPIGKRNPALMELQIRLLKQESVEFLGNGRVNMTKAQWIPEELGSLFEIES